MNNPSLTHISFINKHLVFSLHLYRTSNNYHDYMGTIWTCPNCGSDMRKSIEGSIECYICSTCGCCLDAKEQIFDVGNMCPNCHHVLEDARECPNCGYDLGSDFD